MAFPRSPQVFGGRLPCLLAATPHSRLARRVGTLRRRRAQSPQGWRDRGSAVPWGPGQHWPLCPGLFRRGHSALSRGQVRLHPGLCRPLLWPQEQGPAPGSSCLSQPPPPKTLTSQATDTAKPRATTSTGTISLGSMGGPSPALLHAPHLPQRPRERRQQEVNQLRRLWGLANCPWRQREAALDGRT